MAVYGYARVSTTRQADEGVSLATQERVIAGYAQMLGVSVDKVFIERGVSASVKPMATRLEGAKLLAALEPGDVVITSRLDRAFRSAKDALNVLEDLQKRRISLHMVDLGGDVTGNGISKLVFTILAAVAAAESDKISERVSEIKADERNRNRHLGGSVPFGYKAIPTTTPDGKVKGADLVADPGEQRAIARIKALRAQGKSLRAISAVLKDQGVKLSHEGVARVLAAQAETV
jgi:DNA invertase Pin-like site-specific DNA recombinase